jgi:hypothetical protein
MGFEKNKMITFNDCEKRLDKILKKPAVVDPAFYQTPGIDAVSAIPYPIVDWGDLPRVYDNMFYIDEQSTYYQCTVKLPDESLHPFWVFNSEWIPTANKSPHSLHNHLGFGYGKLPVLNMPKLPFSETIGQADTNRMSWWEECKISARLIKERYGEIMLCLSGGIDSELMVCAFLDAGVNFKAMVLKYVDRYKNCINVQDYNNAMKFCNTYNINPLEITLDIVTDIIDGAYKQYYIDSVPETHFLLPTLYTQSFMIELCNKMGVLPVMGSDQIELKTNSQGDVCIGETLFSLGLAAPTWAHHKGLDLIYDFFMYTPNQIVSYLDHVVAESPTNIGYEFKQCMSYKYGSEKLLRQREKSTGYEYIGEAMRDLGKCLHCITMENIESVDWSRRAATQYIHSIDQVVHDGFYNDWQVIRTTPNDFLCRGFKQNDARYYDI